MDEPVAGRRMTIFVTEDDRHDRRGLSEVILERAREDALSGATVWRAVEGFGSSGRLRSDRFPDAGRGMPLVVEIVDTVERIDAFAATVADVAPGSLVVLEPVQVTRRAPPPFALDDPDSGDPA